MIIFWGIWFVFWVVVFFLSIAMALYGMYRDHVKKTPSPPTESSVSTVEMPVEEHPDLAIWVDEGFICLVVRKATVIEFEDELVPGLAMNPYKAIEVAEVLLAAARKAMEEQEHEA